MQTSEANADYPAEISLMRKKFKLQLTKTIKDTRKIELESIKNLKIQVPDGLLHKNIEENILNVQQHMEFLINKHAENSDTSRYRMDTLKDLVTLKSELMKNQKEQELLKRVQKHPHYNYLKSLYSTAM